MNLCAEEERALRQSICILLALEALLVCLVCLTLNSDDETRLYYHALTAESLLRSNLMIGMIPVGATLLSYFSKAIFIVYEFIHFLIGVALAIIALLSLNPAIIMVGVILVLIFCSPFIHYIRVKPKWNIPAEGDQPAEENSGNANKPS
ncbi:MAG: hypothetical protein II690_03080 [Ruminococcus sp.]|nr:hypothetical protein [Ruminococcus sp.]